jgi:2-methylcitrate dehydratase PrpD
MGQTTGNATARLAAAAAGPQPRDGTTRDRARLLLFDYLAVTRRGAETASSLSAFHAIDGTIGNAIVDGHAARTSAIDAALVNGVSAHSIELDDTYEPASHHPGTVIWPTVLALADSLGTSSDDVLDAAIAGYDVMCHIGEMLGGGDAYTRGFHPTGVCGVFGAAMAASRLLGLSVAQMTNALGIAGASASGSMEYLSDGAWTKRLHPGLAAASGIRAAKLARSGYTGPVTALEGRLGFLHAYGGSASVSRAEMTFEAGAGIVGTSVKLYPCCRYLHGVIDLLSEIGRRDGVRPDDIDSIDCGVLSAGIALIAEPAASKVEIKSDVDAQFSLPFAAALALDSGRASLADFAAAPSLAPRLSDLMRRVGHHTEPALEAAFPTRWGASVRVRTKSGREVHRAVEGFRGSPAIPASWDDVIAKASGLVGDALAAEMAERCRDIGGRTALTDLLALRAHPVGRVAAA